MPTMMTSSILRNEPQIGSYAPDILKKVRDQFKMVRLLPASPMTPGEKDLQRRWRCNSAHYNKTPTINTTTKSPTTTNMWKNISNTKLPLYPQFSLNSPTRSDNNNNNNNNNVTWKTKRAATTPTIRRNRIITATSRRSSIGDLTVKPSKTYPPHTSNGAATYHHTTNGATTDHPTTSPSRQLPLATPRCGFTLPMWKQSRALFRSATAPRLNINNNNKKVADPRMTSSVTSSSLGVGRKYSCSGLKVKSKVLLPKPQTAISTNHCSLRHKKNSVLQQRQLSIIPYPGTPPTTRRQSRTLGSVTINHQRKDEEMLMCLGRPPSSPKSLKIEMIREGRNFGDDDVVINDMLTSLSTRHRGCRRPMTSDSVVTRKVMRWLGCQHSLADM